MGFDLNLGLIKIFIYCEFNKNEYNVYNMRVYSFQPIVPGIGFLLPVRRRNLTSVIPETFTPLHRESPFSKRIA